MMKLIKKNKNDKPNGKEKKKKKKPLTQEEVDRTVEKIRQRYRDYMIEFTKNPRCMKAFEDRYFDARKYQMDMETFLYAEFSVIEELVRREQEEREKAFEKTMGNGNKAKTKQQAQGTKKPGFADKIIEEYQKRIAGYDDGFDSNNASLEMKKLIGAMKKLEQEYWSSAEPFIRHALGKKGEDMLRSLDYTLHNYTERGKAVPKALSQYEILLRSGTSSLYKSEREEKRIILDVAYFLHKLVGTTSEALKIISEGNEERKTVEKCYDFVHTIITDFRLKDLNPESFRGR